MASKRTIKLNPDADPAPKTSKPAPLVMLGEETTIDRLAELKTSAESIEREIATVRADLDPKITDYRDRSERGGIFTKSVQVRGSTANAIATFRDSYAPIDPAAERDMRGAIGPAFDRLFSTSTGYSLRKEKAAELWALLGERAAEFLTEDRAIVPCEGFRAERFAMRAELSADQNSALDSVVKQVASRPALSFK